MENLNAKKTSHLNHIIGRKLKEFGVPAGLSGYQYLKVGLHDALIDPSILKKITQDFYPHVAQKCNTSASRVERAIRHSIEVSFTRGDAKVQYEHFGNSLSNISFKPTNKEFVHTILESIKEDLEEEEVGE